LRSAEEKVRTVRAWARKYESASQPLVGRMYALSHVIEQDMPKAVALLDRLLAELEAYAASTSPAPAGSERGAESATTGAAAGGGRESDVTASANVCSGDAVRTGVPPRQP
jgi:hypothetical protein